MKDDPIVHEEIPGILRQLIERGLKGTVDNIRMPKNISITDLSHGYIHVVYFSKPQDNREGAALIKTSPLRYGDYLPRPENVDTITDPLDYINTVDTTVLIRSPKELIDKVCAVVSKTKIICERTPAFVDNTLALLDDMRRLLPDIPLSVRGGDLRCSVHSNFLALKIDGSKKFIECSFQDNLPLFQKMIAEVDINTLSATMSNGNYELRQKVESAYDFVMGPSGLGTLVRLVLLKNLDKSRG